MPGFFESVAAGKQHRQLLAAWMIEGKASGAKALFAPKGEQMTLLCREERFPPGTCFLNVCFVTQC